MSIINTQSDEYIGVDIMPERNNLHNEDIMESYQAAVFYNKFKMNDAHCKSQSVSLNERV